MISRIVHYILYVLWQDCIDCIKVVVHVRRELRHVRVKLDLPQIFELDVYIFMMAFSQKEGPSLCIICSL